MALDVRFLRPQDFLNFHKTVVAAFGGDYAPDPELDALFEASFDLDLSIGAFDGDTIVATFSSFDLDLRVPGGEVPMAGTTVVSVQPTHRRRGLLTKMMRLHLQQAKDRGQPLAGLWATEYGIYPRFGYGPATEWREISFDTRRVSIPAEPDVNLRFMTPDEARKIAPAVFEAATIDRPGTYGRPDWWWTHRVFLDHKEFRDGLSEQRWVVAEVDGEPVGYVRYRTKLNWENTGANGKVAVREFTATTDQASRALWSFLSTIDLFPQVEFWNAPPDDVLPWIATDPRHINYAISEALWVRILDVAEALERRSYAADGSVVLDIDDAFIPETSGRYELSVTDGTATVTTTDQPADVALGIDMLGSIYLGYHRAGQLQRAARISGSAEGVATLDRLMAWPVPAWTQEIF